MHMDCVSASVTWQLCLCDVMDALVGSTELSGMWQVQEWWQMMLDMNERVGIDSVCVQTSIGKCEWIYRDEKVWR
jgi:hypothetical protein